MQTFDAIQKGDQNINESCTLQFETDFISRDDVNAQTKCISRLMIFLNKSSFAVEWKTIYHWMVAMVTVGVHNSVTKANSVRVKQININISIVK